MESLRGGGAIAGSTLQSIGTGGKSKSSKFGKRSKKRASKKRTGKKGGGIQDPSVVASEQPITMDPELELTLRANAASRDKETAELKKQVAQNLGKVDADKDSEFLCRLCLEPGERRRCCEEWYCNACYYRGKECPSCGHKVQERTLGAVEDAGGEKLTSTLVLSFFFFAAIFGSAALTIYHYMTVPKTLHGQTCAGFLPSCQPGCIEHNADDSKVTLDGPMPTLQHWKPCSRSSKYKIRNPICVVDRTLYERSNRKWGYDFCVTQADRAFDPSLIVFEDDMDDAGNVQISYAYRWHLASAKWRYVVNGARSHYCGALDDRNVETDAKKTLSPLDAKQKGLGVMHFYGDMEREAVTEPINLEHGGRLEFWFKYAKGHYEGCEVQYDGETVLHYSTDDGASWKAWYPLNRILWRNKELQLFREEVPEQARSKQTMFKWKQTLFNPLRDHWALDDVRVFRTPVKDWRNTDEFKRNIAEGTAFLDRASCCLDSFGCRSVGDKTKWNNETCADVISDPDHGKFDALGDNIKGRELVVFVAICVWLMRFCFDVLVWMITHRCAPPKRILLWQPVFQLIDQTAGKVLRWVLAKPDQSIMPSKPSVKGIGAMSVIQKAQMKLKMKAGMNSNTRTRYDAKFRTRFDMKWRKTYHSIIVFSFLVTMPCLFFFQVLTRRSLLRVALALPVGLRPEGAWKNPRNLEAECAAHYDISLCTAIPPGREASVCIWNDEEGYHRSAGRGYCTLKDEIRQRLPAEKRWNYPIPYAMLALAAACLDLLLTQHVMRHVVCITEAGAPRYEFDGRRNEMHITNLGWGKDQTIDLAHVTELRQFPIKTARNMGLQVLFMSLPLLSLTLLSTNVFFIVTLGALCVFRSVLGPLSLVKFFWTVQYIYASVIVCNPQFDYLRIELANALFRPYTLFQIVLWGSFGAPLGIGILWVFDLPWNINLPVIIAGFAVLGACVSCVQGIAVTPMVFLTCLDVGFFVRYVKEQKLPRVACLSGETIAKVTRCEAMLVAYVDNQPRFNDLLRGIPIDADDVADMATHLKYQYSSEDSEGDDDVLDNTAVAANLFAAQTECFQGHDSSESESDTLSDADMHTSSGNPTTVPIDGRKRLPSLSQNVEAAAVAVTEI